MWKSDLPSEIIAGTTVEWVDEATTAGIDETISSPDWTLEYFLRTNTSSEGHIATGTQYSNSTGWQFTISATDSAGFIAGDWFFNAEVSKGAEKYVIGSGQFTVSEALSYTGASIPALNGKSQAVQDLEAVDAALRLITTGRSKEYTIGDRTFKSIDIPDLIMWRDRLKDIVNREQKADKMANQKGNPHAMYVRFF